MTNRSGSDSEAGVESKVESKVEFVRKLGERESLVGRVDFVEPNLNLLAHAQSLELEIGSRCGGHGICGGDRIRILDRGGSGLSPLTSPLTEPELRHLSRSEIEAGYRLACQCFPERSGTSLRIEILPDVPLD